MILSIIGGDFMLKNKIKKSIVLALGILVSISMNVSAEENNINNNYFNRNISIIENVNDENNIKPKSVGYYTKEKVVATQTKYYLFTGYATDSWINAVKYDSGKTYTGNTSFSIFGMLTSLSISKYVSGTIPADPSRFSKLATYADITFKKVEIKHYQGGASKPFKITYRVDKIIHERYIKVKYK